MNNYLASETLTLSIPKSALLTAVQALLFGIPVSVFIFLQVKKHLIKVNYLKYRFAEAVRQREVLKLSIEKSGLLLPPTHFHPILGSKFVMFEGKHLVSSNPVDAPYDLKREIDHIANREELQVSWHGSVEPLNSHSCSPDSRELYDLEIKIQELKDEHQPDPSGWYCSQCPDEQPFPCPQYELLNKLISDEEEEED